jgi:hypothetical protein
MHTMAAPGTCKRPAPPAGQPQYRVLARGFWLKTERCDALVVRSAQWWCPRLLSERLLRELVVGADRFRPFLPVPSMWLAPRAGRPAVWQTFVAPSQVTPLIAPALCRFWEGVERCWHATGWLPDVGGRVYLPWELYSPLRSDNVVIDPAGMCWLVDVGATRLFHSAALPTGRIHAALMLLALRRAHRRLHARLDGALL